MVHHLVARGRFSEVIVDGIITFIVVAGRKLQGYLTFFLGVLERWSRSRGRVVHAQRWCRSLSARLTVVGH